MTDRCVRFPELIDAFRRRFEFASTGHPLGYVVILANTETPRSFIDAAHFAAASLTSDVSILVVPKRPPNTGGIPRGLDQAIEVADFFVDLQTLNWFYTTERNELLRRLAERGGILFPCSMLEEKDVHTYIANAPSESRVRRAELAKELIDQGTTIRVTTHHGTDFTAARGNPQTNPIFLKELKHQISGKYGQAAFTPVPGSVHGVIAATGGVRISCPEAERFHVRQPLRMQLSEGRIVDIDRGTPEGAYLSDWFESIARPDAYAFSHLNLGLVPLSMQYLDNEAVHMAAGGVLAAFGIQMTDWKPGAGVPNHVDFWMSKASYFVDDLPLLVDGELTRESGLALDDNEQ